MADKKNIPKVPKGMKPLPIEKKRESRPEPYKPDDRPTISFDSDQLPQIDSWQAGKSYDLNVRVTMKSIHHERNDKGKNESRAQFVISHVGVDSDAATEK